MLFTGVPQSACHFAVRCRRCSARRPSGRRACYFVDGACQMGTAAWKSWAVSVFPPLDAPGRIVVGAGNLPKVSH